MSELLTVEQLAERFAIPKATIYGWNYRGVGPKRIRLGGAVRYRIEDVETWLAEREVSA